MQVLSLREARFRTHVAKMKLCIISIMIMSPKLFCQCLNVYKGDLVYQQTMCLNNILALPPKPSLVLTIAFSRK
jgi:hypothetical protein